MHFFVVLLTYEKPLADVEAHLEAHRAWLREGYAAGRLLLSGPRIPRTGGVLLAQARDAAEVDAMLDRDPFRRAGIARYEVVAFDATMHDPRLAAVLAAPSGGAPAGDGGRS